MVEILETLHERLSLVRDAPPGIELPWNQWIGQPLDITPWQVWTLLGLIRHRARHQFVADTIKYRLNADQDAIAAAGAFGHPDIPQSGVVPELTDWEYYFHGRGCCLTHRTSGESIDVDFYDSTVDWFDAFFYLCYLESLKEPFFVEERLVAFHPSLRTIRLSMNELLENGHLERFEDRHVVRLAFESEDLCEVLDAIESRWHDESVQRAFAAATGDWFLLEGIDSEDCGPIIFDKLTRCREQRSSDLVDQFRSGIEQGDVLQALSGLNSPALPKLIREALQGSPSGATSAALDIVLESNDPQWCDEVDALLNRVDPNGDIPQPHIWHMCAEFSLQHGRTTQIKKQLRRIKSNCLGDVAILAMEHFPDIAIETFRRALRSEIPCCRITAAAALAIIDQPWSRRELTDAVKASRDHVATSECRSALMTTHSQECHAFVLEWEKENPRDAKQGPYITIDEMSLRMSDETIHWEMEKLHDRILPLRRVAPSQPSRPWWKL